MNESIEEEQKEIKQLQVNLYTVFEKEFGRPLSPFECETLRMWEDRRSTSSEFNSSGPSGKL